jgi:hypothetical protein
MSKLRLRISMPLAGFVAGPSQRVKVVHLAFTRPVR